VFETFSGIGAQAKALKNIGAEYEIAATSEWDIHSVLAYYLIHCNSSCIEKYKSLGREEIAEFLQNFTLSSDGKQPVSQNYIRNLDPELQRLLYTAMKETHNLGSITDIHEKDVPENLDLLTYSFPCQDLSWAGSWHRVPTGISKNVKNRSGMLWEIERILDEMKAANRSLPKYLLMENVTAVLSKRHREDFRDWQYFLEKLGYVNQIYCLNASNFGIPQNRERCYMISVNCEFDREKENSVFQYFFRNNLDQIQHTLLHRRKLTLKDILKTDYSNADYFQEALDYQANDTMSRKKIYDGNEKLLKNGIPANLNVRTLTTRQDRNPNSGVIDFQVGNPEKAQWRYLTPRESLLLMGFEEEDYEKIKNCQLLFDGKKPLFGQEQIFKLAGNSIVVDVLEEIFLQLFEINKEVFGEKEK
jgi:DNA (cytosine-5)-methyltransferase 1